MWLMQLLKHTTLKSVSTALTIPMNKKMKGVRSLTSVTSQRAYFQTCTSLKKNKVELLPVVEII